MIAMPPISETRGDASDDGSVGLRLSTVFAVAQDMSALTDFYARIGLTVRFADAGRWTQLSAGPADVAVADPVEGLGMMPGQFVPVFKTAALTDTISLVLAAGGQVVQRRDMGHHGVAVLVHDPEGNPLVLQGAAT
jgi:predicted enzyme related to lactoylglutathione lyase